MGETPAARVPLLMTANSCIFLVKLPQSCRTAHATNDFADIYVRKCSPIIASPPRSVKCETWRKAGMTVHQHLRFGHHSAPSPHACRESRLARRADSTGYGSSPQRALCWVLAAYICHGRRTHRPQEWREPRTRGIVAADRHRGEENEGRDAPSGAGVGGS